MGAFRSRSRIATTLAAATLLTVAVACSHASAQRTPTRTPAPEITETTHPLPLTTGTPLPLTGGPAAPVADVRLPEGRFISLAAGTAFVETADDRLDAIDLFTGHARWTKTIKTLGIPLPANEKRVFLSSYGSTAQPDPPIAVVDLRTGHTVATLAGAPTGHVFDGTFYARSAAGFGAFDATSGAARWVSTGGGQGLGPEPVQLGDLLLQNFSDSGAILHDDLYAFDVRTGAARYVVGSAAHVYGTMPGVFYVDDTWGMPEPYRPLRLTTIRLADGSKLHEFDYIPDPAQHPARDTPVFAENVHVADGFVYFTIENTAYRYIADRAPDDADASRIDNARIPDVLVGNAVIIGTHAGVAVARSLRDHLELHALAKGTLRVPVARRADGTRLLVVGDTLFALSASGDRAHALGRVTCPDPAEIFAWTRYVAVRCAGTDIGPPQRVLVYADDVPIAAQQPMPTPAIAPAPRFTAHLIVHDLQPPTTFPPQWDIPAIAAAPDGSIVVALQHSGAGPVTATLRRIAPDGTTSDIPLPPEARPYEPPALLIDARGRLWYTDRANPGLVRSYDSKEGAHIYPIAPNENSTPTVPDNTPYAQRPRRFPRPGIPVRIALGPDGAVWFARTHPRPEIGRVTDGTGYAIPTNDGSAYQLIATHEALWYLTATVVGRMTPDGTFSSQPLPASFTNASKGYPRAAIIPGPDNTIWLIAQSTLVQFDAHHIIRTLRLANATVALTSATTACDGTLYAGESTNQLARIDNSGLTEFPVDTAWIAPKLHDTRCHLWYTDPYTLPNKGLGELQISPSR